MIREEGAAGLPSGDFPEALSSLSPEKTFSSNWIRSGAITPSMRENLLPPAPV
jgi:hypothetical protein